MPTWVTDGPPSDAPLGSFCLLPEVDEAEARQEPAVILPDRRKKQKIKKKKSKAAQIAQNDIGQKAGPVHLDHWCTQALHTEIERLRERVSEAERQVQKLQEERQEDSARLTSLQEACAQQQRVIDLQVQSVANRTDAAKSKQTPAGAADTHSARNSSGSRGGAPTAPAQRTDNRREIRPYPGLVIVKTEPSVMVKREPQDRCPAMGIQRPSVHDPHPLVRDMERLKAILKRCNDDMRNLPTARLRPGHPDYRALCRVHRDVTLQIHRLERQCAHLTP